MSYQNVTEIQSEQMLLERWHQYSCWMQGCRKPSMCKNAIFVKLNKMRYVCTLFFLKPFLPTVQPLLQSNYLTFNYFYRMTPNYNFFLIRQPFYFQSNFYTSKIFSYDRLQSLVLILSCGSIVTMNYHISIPLFLCLKAITCFSPSCLNLSSTLHSRSRGR